MSLPFVNLTVSVEKTKTGFISTANKKVDGLISASGGLMCLKNAIMGAIPNPANILSGLASAAAAMVGAIISSVTYVINKRVGQIINSLLSPIRQLENLIANITNLLIDIQNLLDRATNIDNYFKDKQNCSTMASNLLNCLAQSAINKLTNKVTMNVDKYVGNIANKVSGEAFKVNGILSSHIDRNTKFIAKAQSQNKLLT